MVQAYSNEQLFEIGRNNYQTLLFHCVKLNSEGYWTQPEAVMKQSLSDVLDMYVQSFLVMYVASLHGEQNTNYNYIKKITDKNLLNVTDEGISETDMDVAKKLMKAPPIIIQLFCLRDNEKKTKSAKMFVDTLINILISMAYLNQQQGKDVIEYIKNYYERISAFFVDEFENYENINEKFIFKKICNVNFTSGYTDENYKYQEVITEGIIEKTVDNYTEHIKISDEKIDIFDHEDIEQISENEEITEQLNTEKAYENAISENEKEMEVSDIKPDVKDNEKANISNTSIEKHSKKPALKDNLGIAKTFVATDVEEVEMKKRKAEAREAAKNARMEMEAAREAKKAASVDRLMEQLNGLVGLSEVKKEMQSLVNLIKVRRLRNTYDMPIMDMSYHMVFTGNPGTGKTTIARLVAEIYKELGVLSKGTFVETDRSGLVAPYIGQTALKVQEVVESAKGGVLFIDEAYALAEGDATNDFGKEAIDTLVKLMEDNRNDLVIIVAGYKEDMDNFLKTNPGLISRFNKFINFEDYSDKELIEILNSMASKYNIVFEKKAIAKIRRKLKAMDEEKRKEFGNARGIRNTFETIITNQANRIVTIEAPTKEQLCQILAEDV